MAQASVLELRAGEARQGEALRQIQAMLPSDPLGDHCRALRSRARTSSVLTESVQEVPIEGFGV